MTVFSSQGNQDLLPSERIWRSARGYSIAGIVSVFLLIFGLGGWAVFAEISGAVIGAGVVGVSGKSKTVQHLDGGIIQKINVENGSVVKAGEILISLDPTELKANLSIVNNRLLERYAERGRLIAERDNRERPVFSDQLYSLGATREEVELAVHAQESLFFARKETIEGEIKQLEKRISQLGEQISGYFGVQNARDQQLAFINEELEGLRQLFEKGLVPKPRLMALERDAANFVGEVAELRASIASTESQISETEVQKLQAFKVFKENILVDLKEVTAEINELSEQKVTHQEQLKRIDIRAPVSGVVHDLDVHTEGGVITGTQPLLQIIPREYDLIVETQITPESIDQVYIGQKAFVNFPGLSQKTTPELSAHVIQISGDRLIDEVTGIPHYLVNLEIPQGELAKLKQIDLVPGMSADVYIQTNKRNVMSYLVKPLFDQIDKAFREE